MPVSTQSPSAMKEPRLALCVIARNAADRLPACLNSARPAVDAIVVADTGSTDGTASVARGLGAIVFSVPWEDDFSRARNLALKPIFLEWILMLDADEMLDPAAAAQIPALLDNAAVAGYQVPIRNYLRSASERLWDRPAQPNNFAFDPAHAYPAYAEHENVRLFRRQPGIYFRGRVHESVGPSILEAGGKLGRAEFPIHHFGLVETDEKRSEKHLLYRQLGRQKAEEEPHSAQAQFELGLVELDQFKDYAEAERCFARACRLDPHMSVAWLFLGVARTSLEEYPGALAALREAEARGHRTAFSMEAQGDALYNSGDFAAARRCYARSLERGGGVAAASKLGLAEVRDSRHSRGLARLEETIRRAPQLPDLYDPQIAALVFLERLEDAAQAAEEKLAVAPSAQAYLRAASLHGQARQWERAVALIEEGRAHFPDDDRLRLAQSELAARSV